MIKYDFKKYTKDYLTEKEFNEIQLKKTDIIKKLQNSNMAGWTKEIDETIIAKIKETANYIKDNFDCLVVIGIGGSFLGSYAFDKMFRKYFDDDKFEIIYAGTTLSSKHLE